MLFCNKIGAARPARRQRAALLISAALLFLATACDPANEVGQDVLPDEVPSTATYVELPVSATTVLRTDSVLTDTLADARRLGLRVALLPALRDVDNADDLAAWNAAHPALTGR